MTDLFPDGIPNNGRWDIVDWDSGEWDNESKFGHARVDYSIDTSGFISSSIGSPTVVWNQFITISSVDNASTISEPFINLNLLPVGITNVPDNGRWDIIEWSVGEWDNASKFGQPSLNFSDRNLFPISISGTSVLGNPNILDDQYISVSSISSTNNIPSPVVLNHISIPGIESTNIVNQPILSYDIQLIGIGSQNLIGSPLIEKDTIRFSGIETNIGFGNLAFQLSITNSGIPSTTNVGNLSIGLDRPIIENVDNQLITTGTIVTITGIQFGDASGVIELNSSDDRSGNSVLQTIIFWSNTEIRFNATQGSLPLGQNFLFVQAFDSLISEPERIDFDGQHLTLDWITPEGSISNSGQIELSEAGPFTVTATSLVTPIIHYEIVRGDFPEYIVIDRDTGIITGLVREMDDYIPNLDPPDPFTNDNYASSGSASFFSNGVPNDFQAKVVVRAIEDPSNAYEFDNPTFEFYDREFLIPLRNNWSSDRDRFILNFDTQFYLDGNKVDSYTYLTEMKTRGYFVN